MFKTAVDFDGNQSQNFVLEQLTSAPASNALKAGRIFILTDPDTAEKIPYYHDGTDLLPFRGVEATTTKAGRISASDKAKLDAATASNSPNALVLRDNNGDIAIRDLSGRNVSLTGDLTALSLTVTDAVSAATGDFTGNVTAGSFTGDLTGNVTGNLTGTASAIADGSVSTPKIVDLAVTTAKINDNAVTTAKIASAAVTATELASNAVTTAKINDAAVTTAKVADLAITTGKIADAAVTSTQLAPDAVLTSNILDANVTTAKLADSSITTAKVADDAITTAKILDGNVTTNKLNDQSVTSDKVADDAITTVKILDANVTTAKLADSSVTTAKVADGAITAEKLAAGLLDSANYLKEPVKAVAVANVSLTGTQTIDGVALGSGDRVLLVGQTDASENGIYVVDASAWSRSTDANTSPLVDNLAVAVIGGSVYAGSIWTITNTNPDLNSSPLNFTSLGRSAEGYITPGDVEAANLVATGDVHGDQVVASTSMTAPTFIGALQGNADTVTTIPTLSGDVSNVGNVVTVGNGAISTAKLADAAVTNAKVAANAIDTAQIVDSAVTTAKVNDAAITSAKINNGAVITSKLADASVTTAKIDTAAVTANELASDAVTTVKIANSAVTEAKLADSAVTTNKIADAAVTNTQIADSTIALGKLATSSTDGATPNTLVLRDANGSASLSALNVDTFGPVSNSGFISLGSNRLTDVSNPTAPNDATNKSWVEGQISTAVSNAQAGLLFKNPVKAKSTANISLSGVPSSANVDGVTLVAGDRVLVTEQTDATENGIYVVAAGAWTRADDADNTPSGEVAEGMYCLVNEGTSWSDTGWVLQTSGTIALGSTSLSFVQFRGADETGAGDGLTKSGSTLNVVGTSGRISVGTDSIDIDSTYPGQGSIITLGNVTTGKWQADPVEVAYGGTGATDAAGARANLGATTKVVQTIGDGSALSFGVVHNLGVNVVIMVWDAATGNLVNPDVQTTSASTATIGFSVAPASNAYRVVIVG